MKRRLRLLAPLALILASLAVGLRARAGDGGYALVRGVADQSSVVTAQNGAYSLRASVAQPFAGMADGGAQGAVGAGYWFRDPGLAGAGKVYMPIVKR